MRTSGQGFLLAPLTRYGIVLVPLKDSASAGMAVVLPALATTLGVSDLGFAYGVVPIPPASFGNYGNLAGSSGQGWLSPGSSDRPIAMALTVTMPRCDSILFRCMVQSAYLIHCFI